jgi:hypothetical protein
MPVFHRQTQFNSIVPKLVPLSHTTQLHVFLPIMNVLKSKYFSNLSVAQRCLIFAHLPRDRHARTRFSKEFFCFLGHGDGIVGTVEHLEAQTALLDSKIADLTEIAGIDVRPGIALSRHRFANVFGEITFI